MTPLQKVFGAALLFVGIIMTAWFAALLVLEHRDDQEGR